MLSVHEKGGARGPRELEETVPRRYEGSFNLNDIAAAAKCQHCRTRARWVTLRDQSVFDEVFDAMLSANFVRRVDCGVEHTLLVQHMFVSQCLHNVNLGN